MPLEGIGPELMESIEKFMREPHNREVIGRLTGAVSLSKETPADARRRAGEDLRPHRHARRR